MKLFCTLLVISLLAVSCKTYYMTPASLKSQLDGIDPEKIYDAYDFHLGLAGILLKGGKNFYNGINAIEVTDQKGRKSTLPVSSHTAVKMTDTSGRSVVVYFDSMFLKDSLIFASKSHYLKLPVHRNINSLSKIQVQK